MLLAWVRGDVGGGDVVAYGGELAAEVFPGGESRRILEFVSLPFVGRDLLFSGVFGSTFPGTEATYFHGDVVSSFVGMVRVYSG